VLIVQQSFILVTLPYTLLLPPLISILLRPLTYGRLNYIPAGPTPLLFSILAQYHAAVPYMYQYSIGAVSSTSQSPHPLTSSSIALTSKSTSYFIPIQLALSQFPASILPAVVGWVIGYAYRHELIPGTRWRVPRWIFGQGARKHVRQVDGLRQRLEAELSEAVSTGIDGERSTARNSRRRGEAD
jgi:hypothetical protein